jgi:hypothetical protein
MCWATGDNTFSFARKREAIAAEAAPCPQR